METEKETRAEKMKAFSNTAILQRTLGSPLGQLPALSNASPSQEHSVAPSPLIAPREEGSSGRRGAGWLCHRCLFSGKSDLVKWNESCVHFRKVYI